MHRSNIPPKGYRLLTEGEIIPDGVRIWHDVNIEWEAPKTGDFFARNRIWTSSKFRPMCAPAKVTPVIPEFVLRQAVRRALRYIDILGEMGDGMPDDSESDATVCIANVRQTLESGLRRSKHLS